MEVVRLSAVCTGCLYTTRNIPVTNFCYKLIRPQDRSASRRIMSMKNSNDTVRNQTHDLPACSAMPQPMAPLCGPWVVNSFWQFGESCRFHLLGLAVHYLPVSMASQPRWLECSCQCCSTISDTDLLDLCNPWVGELPITIVLLQTLLMQSLSYTHSVCVHFPGNLLSTCSRMQGCGVSTQNLRGRLLNF
jgi:hypothetical protein